MKKSYGRRWARLAWLLFSLVLLVLGGCSKEEGTGKTAPQGIQWPSEEVTYATDYFYDSQGGLTLKLEHNGTYPVPGGMIYCKHPEDNPSAMEFYWYDQNTRTHTQLGSVSDWAHNTTGPVYQDGRLYLFVSTGDLSGDDHWLKLMDFDTQQKTMRELFSEKGGYPYTPMACDGDRILMAKIRIEGSSYLEEYQLQTGERKTLWEADFNGEDGTGETLRHIAVEGDTLFLLIQEREKDGPSSLRIDLYDREMNFLRSIDMPLTCAGEDPAYSPVAWFVLSQNTIYYENYEVGQFFGRISGGTVEELKGSPIDDSGNFAMAIETEQNRDFGIFLKRYSENHELYKVDYATGAVQRAEYHPKEEGYVIDYIYRVGDTLFISTSAIEAVAPEKFTSYTYEVPISELGFEPYTP